MIITVYACCVQRCDGGRHSAAARSADRPAGHAGPAAHLPPQHHPLHRGHFHPAVNDRDNRSGYSGARCIPQQVTATPVITISYGEMQIKIFEVIGQESSLSIFLFFSSVQECVEALAWHQHVSAPADFPCVHGL